MHDQLTQLVRQRGRKTTEADLVREALSQFLDQQADIVSSRLHFQQSFRERLDRLEAALSFHLNIVIYLLTALVPGEAEAIEDAIIAARRDGDLLLEQIKAVRDLSDLDE
ncbi:MAG: hypothetical protein ABI700_00330 [Chloroflexota bacterium]